MGGFFSSDFNRNAALCFEVVITTSQTTCLRGAYTPAQEATFNLICSLKDSGLGYRRIAKVLNERGIKTARGNAWKSPHVHSVMKKGDIRRDRLNRAPVAELRGLRIEIEEG